MKSSSQLRGHWYAGVFVLLFIQVVALTLKSQPSKAPPFPVQLSLADCNTMSEVEIRRVVQIELQNIPASRQSPTANVHISIQCNTDAILLRAEDHVAGHVLHHEINRELMAAVGGERVIAIAATELTLSVWEHHRQRAKIASQPVQLTPPPAQTDSTPSPEARPSSAPVTSPMFDARTSPSFDHTFRLHMAAQWRLYPRFSINMFGGNVGGWIHLNGPFHLLISAAIEGGSATRKPGNIGLFAATSAVGLSLHKHLTPMLVGRLLLGIEGGYGKMEGRVDNVAIESGMVQGVVGGPWFRSALSIGKRSTIGVSAEVGYALFSISGNVNGATAVAMKDIWLMFMIDVFVFKDSTG